MSAEGVALVSLTGSVATGQAVVRASADRLPRLLLELGGHAPFVVLDDADVAEAAAAAARRSFSNMGQICIAVNRVIVAEQVADSFAEAIGSAAADARPGPTDDADTMYGSMTTADAKRGPAATSTTPSGAEPASSSVEATRPVYEPTPTSNRRCSTGSRQMRR